MKETRYSKFNFRMLAPYIDGMNSNRNYKKFSAGEAFDPFVIECLYYKDRNGNPVYSLAHYYTQYGDLMRAPEITISIDFANQTVEPLTYQQDSLSVFQEVYRTDDGGKLLYSPRLRSDLDDFLRQWLKNISAQGYKLVDAH